MTVSSTLSATPPGTETTRLQVRVYDSLESMEFLRPAWDKLLADVPTSSTFSTWEWLAAWWRAFGQGQELRFVAFFDAREELTGMAALAVKDHAVVRGCRLRLLRLMGDGSGDSDNLDVIARPGFEDAVADAFLQYLESSRRSWDFCALNTLPSYSPAAQSLLQRLQLRSWPYFTSQRHGCVIDLPGDWESYRKQLSYNERGQLGKYMRRLEREYKVRFYQATEPDLDSCLRSFFDLHQKRWVSQGEPGSFVSEARRSFYQDISRSFLQRGWLQLWMLELNGVDVGAEYDFLWKETVYCLQGGFDTAMGSGHIGYALRGYVLRQLIETGVAHYDFLAGRQSYKGRWGGRETTYLDLHFARPRTLGALYLRMKHESAHAKEWLRGQLPKSVWDVLRNVKAAGESREKTSRRVSAATKESEQQPPET
jgi:CelD/BcsL family acetyltransferase involved in cellulose biosynthesis